MLMVVIRHFGVYGGFNFGYFALDFLFVVSGYLIGQILLNELLTPQPEDLSLKAVKKFMIRRWFRILPLYYTAILVRFMFDHHIGFNTLYYVFFLQNHFYGITFFPESWTLVIDEWFYLASPLILYFFLRYGSRKRLNILLYLIGIVIFINVMRLVFVMYTDRPFAGIVGNVPMRQDTLFLGVIMALVKVLFPEYFSKFNSKLVSLSAFFLILVYIAVMYVIREPVDRINQFLWTRTIAFSLLSFLVAFTLPYMENSVKKFTSPSTTWLNPIVIWGSKLSYAMYLFHALVFHEIERFHLPNYPAKFTTAFILTLLVCYIFYNLVEKRFLIMREKHFK